MSYIDKVGIELEGAWFNPKNKLGTDYSITIYCQCFKCRWPYDNKTKHVRVGEMRSDKLKVSDAIKWAELNYPDVVNASCGYHVHVSFKDTKSYVRLMDSNFYDYFLNRMEGWGKSIGLPDDHEFWNRFVGDNYYCKQEFYPEGQVIYKTKHDNRRSHLNFAYSRFGTIECRLFPAFNKVEHYTSALIELVSIYEDYLTECDRLSSISQKLDTPFNIKRTK